MAKCLRDLLQKAWAAGGVFGEVAGELEKRLMSCLPEEMRRQRTLFRFPLSYVAEELPLRCPSFKSGFTGKTDAFNLPMHLEACMAKVEQQMLDAAARVKEHLKPGFGSQRKEQLQKVLKEDATPQRLGRLTRAAERVQHALWSNERHEPPEDFLPGLRELLAPLLTSARVARGERGFAVKLEWGEWRLWSRLGQQERMLLLGRLLKLRLVQARLTESFGEEASLRESEAPEPSASAAPAASAAAVPKSPATAATVASASVEGLRRTPEQVKAEVETWKGYLHERADEYFDSPEELEGVLTELAEKTDAGSDFLKGDADVIWRGERNEENVEAMLRLPCMEIVALFALNLIDLVV
eukprot:g13973.t1